MGRLFGTDGIRGRVNSHPMQPELVLRLGLAAGQYFRNGNKRHRVVIGKDTRLSGYVFESALTSGFCAAGMDVFLVGPLPTPAISFLTRSMRADLGVVISASHNPYLDNGIKFFDKDGFKLADSVEDEIAAMVTSRDFTWNYPAHDQVGRARKIQDSPGRYIVELKHSFPAGMTLDGLTIVLDCAHGAAYRVAPLIFEELGARVITLGIEPDGLNINKGCGSLHPEVLAAKVREHRADIGLALDGDADRLIVVDEYGKTLDGDQIMAVCADEMMARGTLASNTLVSTVMSNMALEVFMQERGGRLVRTKVGDRYVVEEMRKGGYLLGGEQSGHLVFMEHSTTGDGTLAALQLLRIMVGRQKPISEIAGLLTPYPQRLVNLKVKKKVPFDEVVVIKDAVRDAEERLGRTGRVLLRYSGTETLARIMVEAQDQTLVDELCASLAEAVEAGLA
jgi:phosphoglucosamine mutase